MSENKNMDFINRCAPKPISSYMTCIPSCEGNFYHCCSEEEYQAFLVSEYGWEKVMRIQEEARKQKEKFKNQLSDETIIFGVLCMALGCLKPPESQNSDIHKGEN